MKKIVSLPTLCLLLLIGSIDGISQSIKQVENKQVAALFAFVEDLKSFHNDNMEIKVFRIGLPFDTISGKATEEIFHRLLITVSETGELPKYKAYELSGLYDVSFPSFTAVDPYNERIEFIHGKYKERKVSVLEINAKTLGLKFIQ